MRIFAALAALLALTSAALADPLPPLDPANARVVIVRESSVMAAIANAKIYLGDEKIGAVASGEVLVFDHAPGHFDLVFDNPLTFFGGNLKLPVDLMAGQTVYVDLSGMVGRMGFVGAVVEAQHAETALCSTDWCAKVVPANDAAYLMTGMTVNIAAPAK